MTVHFIHISKTGGTAIQVAVRDYLKTQGAVLDTRQERMHPGNTALGPIHLPGHRYRLKHVPAEDLVIFSVRDPAARLICGV
jgi:hypothetical protein